MRLRSTVLVLFTLAAGLTPLRAQDYDRPPQGFDEDGGAYGRAAPRERVDAPDTGALAVRMSKMEGRLRDLTGQVEELQNANRKLLEQMQKMEGDIDARLATGSRPKRSEGEPPPRVVGEAAPSSEPARKVRRDDSFDPASAPGAPGTPKPLGSAGSAQSDDPGAAPVDLSGGKFRPDAAGDTLAPTLRLPSAAPRTANAGGPTPAAPVAGAPAAATGPRAEFETALGYFRDKQYEDAEKGFTAFIQRNGKNRLAADATYYLGESYAQRGRSREAAEQYLKVSTDYPASSRAPDAMLHLGISLKAIGAKEQACATFTEVTRKYPNAPAYVRSGAEREAKRAQC